LDSFTGQPYPNIAAVTWEDSLFVVDRLEPKASFVLVAYFIRDLQVLVIMAATD